MIDRHIAVIGDTIFDEYVGCQVVGIDQASRTPKLCACGDPYIRPGGAANVAANLLPYVKKVSLLTRCEHHRDIQDLVPAVRGAELWGVGCTASQYTGLDSAPYRVPRKRRYVDLSGRMLYRVDNELTRQCDRRFMPILQEFLHEEHPDLVVIADYAKQALDTLELTQVIEKLGEAGVPVFANLRTCHNCFGVSLLQMNHAEMLKRVPNQTLLDKWRRERNIDAVVVTAGSDGLRCLGDWGSTDASWTVDASAIPVNTTGAGDTVLAGLAMGALDGLSGRLTPHALRGRLSAMCELARDMADVVVAKTGTAVAFPYELHRQRVKRDPSRKICTADKAAMLCASVQQHGGLCVGTNGVFDILHIGHRETLRKAAALGEFLVVLLNSDKSTQGLKGPGRPICTQEERARMLSLCPEVDAIVIFDEASPAEQWKQIKPAIVAKGPEFLTRPVPEREVVESYGGRVVAVPDSDVSTEGVSTTDIISRIRDANS